MPYDNTNRGSIWKNDRKETENHPDFTGTLNVDGQEFWVSAWKRKEGAAAKAPALTFTVKPKEDRRQDRQRDDFGSRGSTASSRRVPAVAGRHDDMDDEIPF